MYTSIINQKRLSSFVVDAVLLSGVTVGVDRQPDRECCLEVAISGATYAAAGGTISIGAEEFLFSEDKTVLGTLDHSTLSSALVAGIDSGMISIKAVSKTGSPINGEVDIDSAVAVRFYAQNGKVRMLSQGQEKAADYKIRVDGDWDLRENDIIYPVSGIYGIDKGLVRFVRKIVDFEGLTLSTEADISKEEA